MNRRDFLQGVTVASAALLVPSLEASAETSTPSVPNLSEAVRLLYAIERREVTITKDASGPWGTPLPTYRTRDGWTIRIFDDCGEFDYVDSIVAPDGTRWDFDDVEFFGQYEPPPDIVRHVYGIGIGLSW